MLSQHQFTPAPVHSTGLIWFSLIASSLQGPAASAAGHQPGVKWPWPPAPVLMAGEGVAQNTAATAQIFLKWGRNPAAANHSTFKASFDPANWCKTVLLLWWVLLHVCELLYISFPFILLCWKQKVVGCKEKKSPQYICLLSKIKST